MVFSAVFAVAAGIGMVGQWAIFILKGKVPEFETEPYRIGFHLVGEITTAGVLIAAGAGLLRDLAWSRPAFLLGIGMLLYSAVVSPGYFADRRQWGVVLMFAVIVILAMFSLTPFF